MKDYKSSLGFDYERPERISWTCIDVLQFLYGRKWDQIALNYVHALRPSQIRVVEHDMALKCNACSWRVTVYLKPKKIGSIYLPDDADYIERIEQEVEVGTDGIEDGTGYGLDLALAGQPCPKTKDGVLYCSTVPMSELAKEVIEDVEKSRN